MVKILEVKRESCPAARFIGKRYLNGPNWGEWWSNGWFEKLEDFEHVDMEPLEYAVFYLYGDEKSGEFFSMDTHNMCLEELRAQGLKRKEDDWCFERYNCPRYTTPDEHGRVILDYGISVM